MRRLLCVLLVFVASGQAVHAADTDPNYPSDPNELLRVKWDAVISVLQKQDIDPEVKNAEINRIVCPIFDFPLMAKLALGRTHWPKLTPAQRDRFTQRFAERLKTSYREKVALYTNEEAIFKPALRDKKNLRVPMELISNEKRVAVLYKLRKVDERWKIYDVEIQGVSIILTYRSQFDDILHNGSVEDLLSRLENPTTP